MGEVNNATDECVHLWGKRRCFAEGFDVLSILSCYLKLVVLQGRFFRLTRLFVWASDELIGCGADWLLLREGGN